MCQRTIGVPRRKESMSLEREISVLERTHSPTVVVGRVVVAGKVQRAVHRESPNLVAQPHAVLARLLARTIDADVNLSFQRIDLKTKGDDVGVIVMREMSTIEIEERIVVDEHDVDDPRRDPFRRERSRDRTLDRCTRHAHARMRVDHLYVVPRTSHRLGIGLDG
jgi:hypothetical protein